MLTGVIGQIKWHYYVAADVHGYTVVRHKETKQWSMSGIVGNADAFKLAQRPLTFVASYGKGEWSWPIESLEMKDGAITAKLGPQIKPQGTESIGREYGNELIVKGR